MGLMGQVEARPGLDVLEGRHIFPPRYHLLGRNCSQRGWQQDEVLWVTENLKLAYFPKWGIFFISHWLRGMFLA